jgi:hypothetical protein
MCPPDESRYGEKEVKKSLSEEVRVARIPCGGRGGEGGEGGRREGGGGGARGGGGACTRRLK